MQKFKTKGVCAKEISFRVEGNLIYDVSFVGGCPGNTKGVASLVQGQDIEDVISRLKGITCGVKPTSCPDQLALALAEFKNDK